MAVALPGLDGTNHARSLSPIPKQSPKNDQKPQNEPTWARSISPSRERTASPPPNVIKKKIMEPTSSSTSPVPSPIAPTPSKIKSSAFAALRVLEQEKDLNVDTDDISVGYDDGKIVRNSDIGPPSSNSRHTTDPFPTKPTVPVPSLFDGLNSANITTEELIMRATFPLETYAESRYKFERKGIFNFRTSLDKLLSWKNELISSPLHDFDPSLKEDAVQLFRNITGYMGDRFSKKSPNDHYHKILTLVLCAPQELVDELFCQLCKQLTHNPSIISQRKGWELLLICLAVIAPSDDLLPCVLFFCKTHLNDENNDIKQMAEIALHKFYKATLLGVRHTLPTPLEVTAIQKVNKFKIILIIIIIINLFHYSFIYIFFV